MTISMIATIRIREGMMEQAKEAIRKVVLKIKESEPGTLEYIPYTVKEKENVIVLLEKYADENALKAHGANLGKNMVEFGPCCVPERPGIQTLEEI
ncbi:MAG: putative quinol monooxygenase [Promethearchaeota archaeon]|jgi:quinol monooxygenase YgiN